MAWKTSKVIRNFSIALLIVLFTNFGSPKVLNFDGRIVHPAVLLPVQAQTPKGPNGETSSRETFGTDLVQAGRESYEDEQFLAAAEALGQATEIYANSGDVLHQAQALGLQALALGKLGRWETADAAIAQSLSLLATRPSVPSENSRILAQVLNAQGHLKFGRGQAEAALESWRAAEASYQQANAPDAVLGIQINQAQALQSLGFYRRAENLLSDLESRLRVSEDTVLTVKGLLNLGNVLRLGGEVERARDVLSEGQTIAHRLQLFKDEGQALLNLGNTERVLFKRAEAIRDVDAIAQHRQAALQYYQQVQAVAPAAITQVQAQLNQLSLLTEGVQGQQAQMAQAESAQAKAVRLRLLRLMSQLPPSRAATYARVNLARQSMTLTPEEIPDIAQRLATAIQQARTLEDKRAESYALGTLGQLYETAGDRTQAKATTETALTLAQSIQASDIAYQWQWQIGRLLKAEIPDGASLVQQSAAIDYYTAAVETLNRLRSDLVALNPDIQFSFRERVEPVYRELVDLLLPATNTAGEAPALAQLKQARNVMEALQLAELDNFFRDACAQPEAVNIDRLDSTAAVVYPIVLKDRLAVILKLPGTDNLRYYSNPQVNEQQVDAHVTQLLSGLKRRSTLPADLQADAQQIYQWLLEPFAAELEHSTAREQSALKTLVFVLDGSLRNVPMSALYDGEQYLVERYAIALTPGLQLLSPQSLRGEQLRVLVAGATDAPSFTEAGLGTLDNVNFELSGIVDQVANSIRLENENFLQPTIRERLKSAPFDVVHLATHGNFSSNPEQTFLLDWQGRISANDIDTLFEPDDPSQEKSIELLVLSACETASGDKRAALGLAGMAIRADVRSTLATLWQVNDASTAEFMVRFYEQLSQGQLTKSEALRETQIAFLKAYEDTDYNRPFHWAPFTLVGNWL
ncbi:MAG: CHAT domain-containing protein [Cyanobacteria bacterium J06560_6]